MLNPEGSFGREIVPSATQTPEEDTELAEAWGAARQRARQMLSDGSTEADVQTLATELMRRGGYLEDEDTTEDKLAS